MKELFDESVVISNSPLLNNNCQNPLTEWKQCEAHPKPVTRFSCAQIFVSIEEKSSSSTEQSGCLNIGTLL
jgi:hypothetical protein